MGRGSLSSKVAGLFIWIGFEFLYACACAWAPFEFLKANAGANQILPNSKVEFLYVIACACAQE